MVLVRITFHSRLAKQFSSERELILSYGTRRAGVIRSRLAVLEGAATLSQVPTAPPERRHQLIGNRDGHYAVDIAWNYRLIFVPDHHPVPLRPDGGIDTDLVTAIIIIEVIDYH